MDGRKKLRALILDSSKITIILQKKKRDRRSRDRQAGKAKCGSYYRKRRILTFVRTLLRNHCSLWDRELGICYDYIEFSDIQINGKPVSDKAKQELINLPVKTLINFLYEYGIIDDKSKSVLHKIGDIRNTTVHPKM